MCAHFSRQTIQQKSTSCTVIDLHKNRGIFVVVLVWVFLSVRVEGMISCVDGMFFIILLINNFLLSRVSPRSWVFSQSVDQHICVSCVKDYFNI